MTDKSQSPPGPRQRTCADMGGSGLQVLMAEGTRLVGA